MALIVGYGLACLSLYALTAGLFRTELVDVLDAYRARAAALNSLTKIHFCKSTLQTSKIGGRHEIRLAKVGNTRDRSSRDAGSGCGFSRQSSTCRI